jgi:hypothetical protein
VSMCAGLRLDGIAHLSGRSRMVCEQSNLRECGPRDFRTKGLNEMARFGEDRRLEVARSLVVDVIFLTLYCIGTSLSPNFSCGGGVRTFLPDFMFC